jgi:hypothetical protein
MTPTEYTIKQVFELSSKIARRAATIGESSGMDISHLDTMLDVANFHFYGMSLKLEEILVSDKKNFMHDVMGILVSSDEITCEPLNGFIPIFKDEGER